ncbi:hypothetical protein BCV70DRAFT_200386 [Testicularia cyperi]|uniref:Uncharacterized protein n=1 Tax=Testicularia cyperi TaxID=1882483 RepID=A0A317XPL6_9BASI|nr:hypothetical protein BCV70DRAFT_200386 [Testicularia cyperi]
MSDSIYAPHNQSKLEAARAADAAVTPSDAVDSTSPAAEKSFSAQPSIQEVDEEIPPNPHLVRPLLYISGVDPNVTDKELAGSVFESVLPVRLKIDRSVADGSTASGTVEFQTLEKAEKAYAIVRPPIQLRISEDASQDDPPATAKPLLVKQLPPSTDDAMVYDMFRAFGPLVRATCLLTNPAGIHTGFKGMASLQYYTEEDAQRAQDEMHCVEVGGKTISVAVDTVVRKVSSGNASEFSAAAPAFVPGKSMSAAAPAFAPSNRVVSDGSSASIYAPAPLSTSSAENGVRPQGSKSNLQYSNQAATYVDPTNLFIKNLDPEYDSNDLFNSFRSFGRIVSARVMRDAEGKSREFGFVSFTNAAEASRALQAMDNKKLKSKKITVRLHEPKTMRQEKLAARFGSSGGEGAEGNGSASPGGEGSDSNGSPAGTPKLGSREPTSKADKRQSRSYFKAGVPANSDGMVDEEQLRSLSAVVRNELLAGEFNRRVQQLPSIKPESVDGIVSQLVDLRLADAVDALNNPISLIQRVNDARDNLPQSPVKLPTSLPPASSGHLGVPGQRTVSGTSSVGDNASIMSAAPASTKERERLLKAVIGISEPGAPVEDIADMLASLPKKDRALCLFNPEFLRQKVDEAKDIIDMSDESEGETTSPSTLQNKAETTQSNGKASDGVETKVAAASPAPSASIHTIATLAALPASEIVELATSPSGQLSSGLPLPKADPEVVKSTDAFIDSLAGKPAHDQKQKLGDQLFKKVRTFGVKGAPKITIHLLDTEDLRSLAHLMNSYEPVLKEKVLQKVAAGLNK